MKHKPIGTKLFYRNQLHALAQKIWNLSLLQLQIMSSKSWTLHNWALEISNLI